MLHPHFMGLLTAQLLASVGIPKPRRLIEAPRDDLQPSLTMGKSKDFDVKPSENHRKSIGKP